MVNRLRAWTVIQPWLGLATLAASTMEVSWIALWFRLMIKTQLEIPYWRAFWGLGGILWATWAFDRWMAWRGLGAVVRRLGILGMIFISWVIGLAMFQPSDQVFSLTMMLEQIRLSFEEPVNVLPVEFVIILTALLMSWRGSVYANVQPDSESITGGFRTGVIMIFIYGLIPPVLEFPLAILLFLFLGSGLLAMSTIRLAAQSKRRGGKSIPFERKWLVGLSFTILIVIFSSWGIVSWIKGAGIGFLYAIYTAIVTAIIWLVSPLLWLMDRFVTLINQWMRLDLFLDFFADVIQSIRTAVAGLVESVKGLFDFLERLFGGVDQTPFQIPKPVVLWGTILFVVVIVLLTLRKHVWKDENVPGEEMLSESEATDLFGLLRSGINRVLDQLKQGIDDLLGLRHARMLLAAARVRRIYTSLLKLSARLDLPRPRSNTPLEFLPKLARLFPDRLQDLDTITQAYVRVRYGELVETQNELERVERAWQAVKTEGEQRLRPVRPR